VDFPPDFLKKPDAGEGRAAAGMAAWLALSNDREARKQFEIAVINAKLREHGGNITRTAAAKGIHRQSLQEKLLELGIRAARE